MWTFLLDHWASIRITFCGDNNKVEPEESAIMISNHQDDLDIAVMIKAYQMGGIWSVETKYIIKQSVAYIPFFGWSHYLLGDLFVKRRFEEDEKNIKEWLSAFTTRGFKRIVLFPEGTRMRNGKKLEESQQFARKNNLPVLNHVLYPRTKGFTLIVKYFRDQLARKDNDGNMQQRSDASVGSKGVECIYDLTFGYVGGGYGLFEFLTGPPHKDIHIHISRHQIKDLPSTEEGLAQWCFCQFQIKDRLMQFFKMNNRFPSQQEVESLGIN